MRRVLVMEDIDGKTCELIFYSMSGAINYLQLKEYNDYEISNMISLI